MQGCARGAAGMGGAEGIDAPWLRGHGGGSIRVLARAARVCRVGAHPPPLTTVRWPLSAQGVAKELLFVLTEHYRFFVLQWDPAAGGVPGCYCVWQGYAGWRACSWKRRKGDGACC